MFLSYLLLLAVHLAPRLPLRLGYLVADRVGDLIFLADLPVRSIFAANLRNVLGAGTTDDRLAASTRLACRNLARYYFDLCRLWKIPAGELEAISEIEGIEHVEQALEQGRGVVLVTLHFGVPEIIGRLLASRGYHGAIVVARVETERAQRILTNLRRSDGIEIVPVDQLLVGLVRTLGSGGVVALVGDRDETDTGIEASFFGHPAHLPAGALRLAQRTGAPVVVAACQRLPGPRYHVAIEPPMSLPVSHDPVLLRDAVGRLARQLERVIQRDPEQWITTVPLWGERPAT